MIADDLSHWSDVFTWREHQFQMVANAYESITAQDQVIALLTYKKFQDTKNETCLVIDIGLVTIILIVFVIVITPIINVNFSV